NRTYRHKDRPTNVLAFPQSPTYEGEPATPMLGDVIVALSTAAHEAHDLQQSLEERVVYLLLHGILHLLGHDHEGSVAQRRRMDDFYELFQDDAVVASQALNIALTARNKQQDDSIPMCGVPIHSAESYIDRLLQQGFKVAIAEQLEDPRQAEGLVKRDIVRVITPGTVVSGPTLTPKEHNFLASIAVTPGGARS